MSVRIKISLLISAAGFFSALIFSSSVIYEMLEQPFRVMDAELRTVAFEAAINFDQGGAMQVRDSKRYWIKIYRKGLPEPVYVSSIAKQINLPEWNKRKNLVYSPVPDNITTLEHDNPEKTAFRMRKFIIERDEHTGNYEENREKDATDDYDYDEYVVYTALSAERVVDEIKELIISVAVGMMFSVIIFSWISYGIAGYILRPVRLINLKTKNITEKNLSQRIPFEEKKEGSDEFNALAITLNGVFDRLENAFNRQKRLIADASHELKTPLTIIRLIADDANLSGSISEDDSRRLSEQVRRMEKLIKNILSLSSLEMERTAEKKPVDLRSIIEPLADDYKLLASSRSISFEISFTGDLTVQGDYERLVRVFSNIIDNAVKYSADNGEVRITCQEKDNTVEVLVFNRGEGIPSSALPRIFEQFYRVEQSRAHKYGGSGLGLAIVKRIMELHGGSIDVESVYGESVTVKIVLNKK